MKVCHMTSAHPQEDIRIFHKECASLAAAGYEVHQVACGEEYVKLWVHQAGIGPRDTGKAGRMIRTAKRVYNAALKIDADIYHFHDPELLPYGLKLKRRGKKVIFDSHEDVPGQITDKTWIPKPLRKAISGIYRRYETYAAGRLDAVVAATPYIGEKFSGRARKTAVVNNYPKLDDVVFHDTPFEDRETMVCYAGAVNDQRGENIMKEAMKSVGGRLIIAGDHAKEEQGNVSYVGKLDRAGVNELYGKAVAGLCILKPTKNYVNSQPIKMYEYMAAGLPFVCSDFPAWWKIAEESGAGICVDPTDTAGIAEAVNFILKDRERAQAMGRAGYEYVTGHCTWANEEKKLLELYRSL